MTEFFKNETETRESERDKIISRIKNTSLRKLLRHLFSLNCLLFEFLEVVGLKYLCPKRLDLKGSPTGDAFLDAEKSWSSH